VLVEVVNGIDDGADDSSLPFARTQSKRSLQVASSKQKYQGENRTALWID